MTRLALLLVLLLPLPLSGQISLEASRIQWGPVTSSEESHFVRFGSDGWATLLGITLEDGHWYAALRIAPTTLHRWPTSDTVITSGGLAGKRSDPRNRWHYRNQGRPVDHFVWSEIVAGRTLGPLRIGAGLVQLSQTSTSFWGAHLGPQPLVEASIRATYGMVGVHCRASAVPVAYLWGRWSVLEHAARKVGDSSVRRVIVPLACGVHLTREE